MNPDTKDWIVTIPKKDLSALDTAHAEGKIHVVDSLEKVGEAVEILRREGTIGFDTETKPSFKKGQVNKVALMQLSTRDTCFLFRINHIGLPEPLKLLLEDGNVRKIGLSIHDDFHHLHLNYDVHPAGFTDLQNYVKAHRILDNSLSRIYAILFGKRISKSQRLTNWEAAELSPAQQAYAAFDAFACLDIFDKLNSGSFVPEESPYFQPRPIPGASSPRLNDAPKA